MKKIMDGSRSLSLLSSAVLGLEILLLLDILVVFWGKTTHPVLACGLWLLLTAGMGALLHWNRRRICGLACMIPAVLGIVAGMGFLGWRSFNSRAGYQETDLGKAGFYGNKKVMLVVPHQDDEYNILGGVLEAYSQYGSALYPVFVTNGDYVHPAQTRYQEALAVFDTLDVPKEQVFFLGYGNEWSQDGPHLYHGAPGQVLQSYAGKTETYGTDIHPAYREGRPYTVDHLMEDLRDVILEIRPDVIFCSDYDDHVDHIATSMLFEKVMGRILKENPEYAPVVYKAYAYSTAWEAAPDYYADNMLSTQDPFEGEDGQRPVTYRWEDRARFPVDGTVLSRSLVGSGGYEMLKLYRSQAAHLQAASVVNGDKVAWQRRTDSLCLKAEITVSSGAAAYLNDFMLVDNEDIMGRRWMPYDGVWSPERNDPDRTVTVKFEEPTDLDEVVLYDHPSPDHNVQNAAIVFEDGTMVETGALHSGGAATPVSVKKENVTSFRIVLKETEGENAGLSEIEAFGIPEQPDGRFLKLMDGAGNFLYDYQTEQGGEAVLSVYRHGDLPALTPGHYSVETQGRGTAVWENGEIRISCPAGEIFTLQVTCHDAEVSDSVVIRNPGKLERFWTGLWQTAEKELFLRYSQGMVNSLLIPNTLTKVSYVLRHLG